MKLIDKSALVAEIEKWISGWTERLNNTNPSNPSFYEGGIEMGKHIISFLDTLEVKWVDLDYIKKELDELIRLNKPNGDFGWGTLYNVATHFFELGMSVSNPITAADRGTAEEIIINLKRVEKDYRINLTKEIEWLRNKVQIEE